MKTFICPKSVERKPPADKPTDIPLARRIMILIIALLLTASSIEYELSQYDVRGVIIISLAAIGATGVMVGWSWLAERLNWRRFNNIWR